MRIMRPVKRPIAVIFSMIFAMALLSSAAFAADGFGAPLLSSLGAAEGLPNLSVSSIVQDGRGFLWFGTQGGLVRYDGGAFKLFCHEPSDASSLPHDAVQTLFLDGESLWVGTYGGLARLDLRTERFVSYRSDPLKSDSLSCNVVTSICRDKNGSLWIGTISGLNLLDEKTLSMRRFMPSTVVRAIRSDRSGRLWIGTSGSGLARYNYGSGTFAWYRKGARGTGGSLPSDHVMAIDQDSSGRLWIGSWDGGLSLFDPDTGNFENHPTSDGRVYALCADEEGIVYVGTWGGGLLEYDIASRGFSSYRATGEPGSLASDVVYALCRDAAGELWIGTNGGGLSKLDRSRRGYSAISSKAGGLPAGKVYAILVDRKGRLWASVYNKGIVCRDPSSPSWRSYRHESGISSSLPDDTVDFLREDSQGEIWAGTNDGLAHYDRASDSFSTVRPKAAGEESPAGSLIYDMSEDPSGGLWLAANRQGLYYWNRGSGGGPSFIRYMHDGAHADSLSDDLVTCLARDGSGKLWVGTNRGLNRFEDPAGRGRFTRYLSSDSINTIYFDSRKLLWIGASGGGLMRYESATDSFVRYTKRDGLPSNSVVRILEDASGNLWVATQAGLAVYDRALGRLRLISMYSNFENPELFAGAFTAPDGTLFFGATDRIYHFDPARYLYNDHVPPIVLTSVSIEGGRSLGPGALADLERGKRRLDLSWKENALRLEFAALDYRDPARNLYSYKLEGFDSAWSDPCLRRSASYTNLPGGSYVFRVKASNNDGLWNEEGIALQIKVRTAPWASPAAYALYAILLVVGGYLLSFFLSRASLYAARAEADSLRSRLVEAGANMERAAIVDSLTGLPNRRKAEEHLDLAFSRALLRQFDLAVLLVDIDRFKAYNDQHGRAAGDECLKRVARSLSSSVEALGGVVARYGGEEFLVVLEDTDEARALAVGEELRRAVESLAIPLGAEVLTISVGCASGGLYEGQSPASLVSAAEHALLAAKILGRNRSTI
jgi:diguanylate cyclase (GGDEF)-like protein